MHRHIQKYCEASHNCQYGQKSQIYIISLTNVVQIQQFLMLHPPERPSMLYNSHKR
jgi:hypothetical protein